MPILSTVFAARATELIFRKTTTTTEEPIELTDTNEVSGFVL